MDYIEGLAKQASQLTMYDIKSYYNQAKNAVLNVSEMEAKVREATNDDPWGASSTLMQQIADGTHDYQNFNEIMPCIYSRFMEKEAREWRQIYKALTLLEFLVKNGSERVVDDARAHVSTVKMLRSFHYVDEKGKDQGINVRNRASEIALLLGDVDKIRQERRKAKSNKNKYQGTGNDGGMSFVTAGGSRYGGFGSDSLGAGGAGGGGGGEGGYRGGDDYRGSRNSSSWNRNQGGDAGFDEYEGADDFDDQPPRRGTPASGTASRASTGASRPQPPPKTSGAGAARSQPAKPAEKPKEVNLFDFDDEDSGPAAAPAAVSQAQQPILGGDDDDFDDFQTAPSATPAAPAQAAPAATALKSANAGLFDMLGSTVPAAAPAAPRQAASTPSSGSFGFASSGAAPNYISPISAQTSAPPQPAMTSRPSYTSGGSGMTSPALASSKPATSASAFDDLFSASLSGMSTGKASSGGAGNPRSAAGGKTIKEMEQEKAMNSLWGNGASAAQATGAGAGQSAAAKQAQQAGNFDDLLM